VCVIALLPSAGFVGRWWVLRVRVARRSG